MCVCLYRYDYDLDAWRKGSYLPNKEFEVLDADQQAGGERGGREKKKEDGDTDRRHHAWLLFIVGVRSGEHRG
jgi:hypothetical protein